MKEKIEKTVEQWKIDFNNAVKTVQEEKLPVPVPESPVTQDVARFFCDMVKIISASEKAQREAEFKLRKDLDIITKRKELMDGLADMASRIQNDVVKTDDLKAFIAELTNDMIRLGKPSVSVTLAAYDRTDGRKASVALRLANEKIVSAPKRTLDIADKVNAIIGACGKALNLFTAFHVGDDAEKTKSETLVPYSKLKSVLPADFKGSIALTVSAKSAE